MITYKRYRYPQPIISHAIWLYHRFTLSFRDIEEILNIKKSLKEPTKTLFGELKTKLNQRA